jgi:RNA polymerase sigma-70 factor, ECF subfamily
MSVTDEQQRFRTLYEAHRREVLSYCGRRVSAADAADACAETFLVAWRRLEQVPPPPRSLPYLYGVAARVIANQRRTVRNRARLRERLSVLGVSPPAEPSLLYLQSEQDQRVIAALRRLDQKDQEILMLDAWENLPREEIAELMGMTRTAINQRIHRSHQRLARLLRSEIDSPAAVAPPRAEEAGA